MNKIADGVLRDQGVLYFQIVVYFYGYMCVNVITCKPLRLTTQFPAPVFTNSTACISVVTNFTKIEE
jgi:hypothetical protein